MRDFIKKNRNFLSRFLFIRTDPFAPGWGSANQQVNTAGLYQEEEYMVSLYLDLESLKKHSLVADLDGSHSIQDHWEWLL